MGCGSSKQAPAAAAAPDEPPAAQAPVQQARGSKVQVVASSNTVSLDASPFKKERDVHSANSNDSVDSGITSDEYAGTQAIITEDTEHGEIIAATDRPETPDFELSGEGYRKSQKSIREMSAVSQASTTTTQSCPAILERPKSRGGVAFDMVYDEPAKTTRMPARLKAIEHKNKIKRESTLAELESKLAAAERRRSDYERRVKAKMLEESQKVEMAGRSLTRQKSNLGANISKSEDKARENREKHLKQMRDKLRAKEKKAKQVRMNKERIARESTSTAITA